MTIFYGMMAVLLLLMGLVLIKSILECVELRSESEKLSLHEHAEAFARLVREGCGILFFCLIGFGWSIWGAIG